LEFQRWGTSEGLLALARLLSLETVEEVEEQRSQQLGINYGIGDSLTRDLDVYQPLAIIYANPNRI
jgi:hypothetical protein